MPTYEESIRRVRELKPIRGKHHLSIAGDDSMADTPSFSVHCLPGKSGHVLLGSGRSGRIVQAGFVVKGGPDPYVCLKIIDERGCTRALNLSKFFDYVEKIQPDLVEKWPLAKARGDAEDLLGDDVPLSSGQ